MSDISVTAANVLASAAATIVRSFNLGATVTAGQAVYLSSTTNTWMLANSAGTTGSELATTRGIALNGGASGQPVAVVTKDPGFTPGGTLTNGSTVYVSSANAGGITHTAPTSTQYPVILGLAISTTVMNLNPAASGNVI